MGVLYGWVVLGEERILEGVVQDISPVAGDGDWCFHVAPSPHFEQLLVNPWVGKPNTSMTIECEIEPPDNLLGRNAEDNRVMQEFLHPLWGRLVRVTGPWVVDLSHRYDGESSPCILSPCNDGKTEIHPITSIFHYRPEPDPSSIEFDFFVFSDDSSNFPTSVPHSGENRIGNFRIHVPEGATWEVRNEVDMARRKSFEMKQIGAMWTFEGNVESGTPGEGKGFYYGLFRVHYPGPALGAGEVQFLVATEDGKLLHTIRHADGSWQPAGDAGGATGIGGPVRALAAAGGAPGEVQFLVAMEDGKLLHTIRHADGSWQPAGNAGGATGIAGPVRALAAAAGGAAGEVQFLVAMEDGKLLHTIRHADGSWQPAGNAGGATGIAGPVRAVSAARGGQGDVQFLVAMEDGKLLHTIRRSNGSWQPAGDATTVASIDGPARDVAAAGGAPGEVHVLVATEDGRLRHTIRFTDGSWQRAGDAHLAAGIDGPVREVAAAGDGPGEVQVLVATEDGKLRHTIRFPHGSWQPAGDASGAAGIDGTPRAIAAGRPAQRQPPAP